MGLFDALGRLTAQGHESSKTFDPAAQAQQGLASMRQANAFLAQQTEELEVLRSGIDAVATVTAVRQTGRQLQFQPVLELELVVAKPDEPPYPVTTERLVEQLHLHRAVVGARVRVRVAPGDPQKVWINWAATV